MTQPRKRLLTIAHSYVVDVNRRLADELAAHGDWDVTAVAPARLRGDFGWHTLEPRASERCEVIPVPVRCPRSVHLMTYGPALSSLLRQPWDLVHCWEEPYVLSAAQIARATPPHVPLVFATFQNIAKRYPPPFNWIERYALSRASGVIAFGRTVYDVAATRMPRDIPMRVISPGVDLTQFKPDPVARATIRHESGWAEHEAVVGFVGRFVEEKGIRVLTAALDRVRAPWRALFIGGGPLEGELTAWARSHSDRVRIVHSVKHTEVASYLNAMDVLCAPSQTTPRWREQFGRMLIEAFACGVPVIASDSGEIPHVVGDAGVIVGEHDMDGWTRAIEDLLADAGKRESLAARGRQRAARMFSLPAVARQHLDFFDELVGQPAMRASAR
jgi:glycosyltransferase involved in cell wall biosynthesis